MWAWVHRFVAVPSNEIYTPPLSAAALGRRRDIVKAAGALRLSLAIVAFVHARLGLYRKVLYTEENRGTGNNAGAFREPEFLPARVDVEY